MPSGVKLDQSNYEHAARAHAAGELQTAATFAEKAVAANPRNADALHLRGLIALSAGDLAQAQIWLARAVQALAHPVLFNSLCVAQTRLRAYADAAATARSGLAVARERFPEFDVAVLWYNLGVALQMDANLDAAAQSYREVLARNPLHSACHNNLGTVTKDLGELPTAIEHFERAVALEPRNREAQSNLGHALLAAGRYEAAWPYFEQRWASFQSRDLTTGQSAPVLPIARWESGELPGERRLLVLHEQGFGDALQFCRYLPMVLSRATRVGYACPAPLRRLFEQSLCARWPNLELIDDTAVDLSEWDGYCSLMSLPMLLGTRLDTIPAALPYLYADPQASQAWAGRLAALGNDAKPRIGIVWAGGNTGFAADALRSLAPEKIATLVSWTGAHWISLQKADAAAKQLPQALREQVVDWMDEVGDFADTAALISSLDLVVAVDTSVAHVAAALGKRVWLLNRFAGCWRWLRDREDSPWYPGMRLFNQTERGNWDGLLARVRAELEATGIGA
jgi:tetratricopeptide (TPR) repeat protein